MVIFLLFEKQQTTPNSRKMSSVLKNKGKYVNRKFKLLSIFVKTKIIGIILLVNL